MICNCYLNNYHFKVGYKYLTIFCKNKVVSKHDMTDELKADLKSIKQRYDSRDARRIRAVIDLVQQDVSIAMSRLNVKAMSYKDQGLYLNRRCRSLNLQNFLIWKKGAWYDVDDLEHVIREDEMFDLLLSYNSEYTDLQNKVFCD